MFAIGRMVSEGADEPGEQLVERCKAARAAYKCPKEWITVPAIPRTAFGKPDFVAIHTAVSTTSERQ
jgi:acyl-coenzyme A synthetase/AMP-(fatty) acid ligase